ncbi:formylglycine-generating enzyme family protein [Breznakiellaceae bacterium SP9]
MLFEAKDYETISGILKNIEDAKVLAQYVRNSDAGTLREIKEALDELEKKERELLGTLSALLTEINARSSMVPVPAGTFSMGSTNGVDNEKPVHRVTLSRPFHIGKYPVTQKEWTAVMGSNPSDFKGDKLPVENVSWFDAVEYCNKRSQNEGLTPAYTRNGDTVTWNTSAAGYRLPTEAEWEWTAKGGGKDSVITEYSGSNDANAVAWYKDNSGGSWSYDAAYLRSANREYSSPTDRSYNLGFRVVRP